MFLRPGKAENMYAHDGKSYVFTKADVAKVKKAYAAFVADLAARKAAKGIIKHPTAVTGPQLPL